MRPIRFRMMVTLLAAAALCGASLRAARNQAGTKHNASFVGQIMDSKCATSGSHETMGKKLGAKDARECTLLCAKNGSFVLYDPQSKTVYQLSDQQKPVPFAGEKVKVSGSYDQWSQTIDIESIEPVS